MIHFNIFLLQHKMCGNNDEASNFYTQALHVYQDIMKQCAEVLAIESADSLKSQVSTTHLNKADEILEILNLTQPGSKMNQQFSALVTSYAATMSNLGVLYKQMVEMGPNSDSNGSSKVSAMDRQQLLVNAEDALQDASALRTHLLGLIHPHTISRVLITHSTGASHRDSVYSTVQLCGVWRLQNRGPQALDRLNRMLDLAIQVHGER